MLTERTFHGVVVWAGFAIAVLTLASLLRLKAPYGRYYSGRGWGPEMSNRVGWVVMELPATILFAGIYCIGKLASEPVPLILLGIWQCHQLNRAFVYTSSRANRGQEDTDGGRGQRVRLQLWSTRTSMRVSSRSSANMAPSGREICGF